MTIEELQRSDAAKAWMAELLKQRTFNAVLDALEKRALPSGKSVQPQLVPGVHPDTTLSHDTHYWAGWCDCIRFIKSIPTGNAPETRTEEEELFAHTDEVRQIDKELERLRKPATAAS